MGAVLDAYRARIASGGLTPDPAQAETAALLDQLNDALARWRPGGWFGPKAPPRGLYIHGPVGRGKSMLMDLFFETAAIARKRRWHFHEFMLARHAFMREARARARDGDGQDAVIVAAARAVAEESQLLCFDEVQVTDIADAMILGRLFERLFALNVVMVCTANRPPDQLYKNGLNRQLFLPFIALLQERLQVAALDAARDYRLERLMAAPVYYTPLGPAASAALDAAWARLTFDAQPHPVHLDVGGRALVVERQAAGVARFTFEDLCAKPLGAADYLEIAERFHTVLIEGVPKLTPQKREEAARFRNLVDALYEAKAKLVIAADAPPAQLYVEGDQSFEFERTASRLMEMRSQDYLALPRRDAEWKKGLVD
jgi:cell division protein ZapE